jgi:branched-chain amino acid transport system ATP-binding protein
MIEIENISLRFGGVVALNDVSVTFKAPVCGIIGPNGAGKTTLMNVVSGFLTPTSGRVLINKTSILEFPPHIRSQQGLRRSFQKEQIAEDLSVFDNILVQLDALPMTAQAKRDQVWHFLRLVGLAPRAEAMGGSLTGFERRVTDLVRCLVGKPSLIMFDEPAGGLSVDETRRLGDLILAINGLTGAQTLIIDHDVELIARVCKETLVLDFGKRIAFGPTRDALADSKVKSAYLGTAEDG